MYPHYETGIFFPINRPYLSGMRKNQKYTQADMYKSIDLWKESGLSQQKYSKQNGIAYNTFKYWLKKYQGEKETLKPAMSNSFLPVKIKTAEDCQLQHTSKTITITYPNGIEVRCPSDISAIQLKTLLTRF